MSMLFRHLQKAAIVIVGTSKTDESLSDKQVEEAMSYVSDEDEKNLEDVGSVLVQDAIQQSFGY